MESGEKERFWAYVTAFGALWGSMEITLGSFLHVLRFPFAGILLASISAALLVLTVHKNFSMARVGLWVSTIAYTALVIYHLTLF